MTVTEEGARDDRGVQRMIQRFVRRLEKDEMMPAVVMVMLADTGSDAYRPGDLVDVIAVDAPEVPESLERELQRAVRLVVGR